MLLILNRYELLLSIFRSILRLTMKWSKNSNKITYNSCIIMLKWSWSVPFHWNPNWKGLFLEFLDIDGDAGAHVCVGRLGQRPSLVAVAAVATPAAAEDADQRVAECLSKVLKTPTIINRIQT